MGSGNSRREFVEEEYDNIPFSRNYAKKKNNFIRLGRENPRQTNFNRLGRSGGAAGSDHAATAVGGEYYNSGYITSALSDPLRFSPEGGEVEDNTNKSKFNKVSYEI
ncbi:unnamed protein product [Orchesella dallaii]|uniref:Uncharacterized protein n=1 Tax=Orchesella dallaii TaxID=48710 RepID=A0ABP1RNM3_9HEXA